MIVNFFTSFSEDSVVVLNLIYVLLNFYKLVLPVLLINYFTFSTVINIFISNNVSAIRVNKFSVNRFFFKKKLFIIKL
jgi:hypothetical protein